KPGIFVLTSPSGGGKTTLVKFLRKKFRNMIYSVSTTTREPREGERNGIDYNFVSVGEFKKMIKRGEFIEWARVHGHYYGTPKRNIALAERKKRDIVLDLDVKGARNLKKLYPRANIIFITAPSMKELRRRLLGRGKDSSAEIRMRLKNAVEELKQIKYFDWLVINDRLRDAEKKVESIVLANSCKINSEKQKLK
ncbi:MAG: guanylate kinase, partial [Elusimicrobia bacterium]|nr:guanylate kinase [Elusimicrobiota bacterium]